MVKDLKARRSLCNLEFRVDGVKISVLRVRVERTTGIVCGVGLRCNVENIQGLVQDGIELTKTRNPK